jgi:hypothetical protein
MRRKFLIFGVLLLALCLTITGCKANTPEPTKPPVAEGENEPEAEPEAMGPQEFEMMPIVTTASDVTGIGTYVASEAFAMTHDETVEAVVLPFGIYPDMHIVDISEFEGPESAAEGYTFEWALEAPEGSAASLTITGSVAVFLADVGGDYELSLTATDEEGLSGSTTWTVHATNYIGNGGIAGEPAIGQCAACHAGQVEDWTETGHALLFIEGIDGVASDYYGAQCINCHTTGFNNRPEAVNGGFDDLAAESTWLFPEVLEEGNWDAMIEEYPELASMALIQCESCHGPGADHYTGDVSALGPISVSLAYGNCAQCHAEQTHHVFPMQWEVSSHADTGSRAFSYPIGEGNESCVRCHSGAGFIDTVKGEEEVSTEFQVISCAVCHDPHDAANPAQLRVYDALSLYDGTELTGIGASATCMSCHNAQRDGPTIVAGALEGESFNTPHHDQTATEMMLGTGGYTWGETVDSSPHGLMVENTCVACHMAPTPGMNDMGTPDDSSDDEPLPGKDTVGAHTFAMVSSVDGTENVAACASCHPSLESFEFEAKADYDGDGEIESHEAELEGLIEALEAALTAKGVVVLDSRPYFEFPANAGEDVYGAAWNLKWVSASGSAVHNFKYALGLLQLSLEKLGG